jgi:hypothetical protein
LERAAGCGRWWQAGVTGGGWTDFEVAAAAFIPSPSPLAMEAFSPPPLPSGKDPYRGGGGRRIKKRLARRDVDRSVNRYAYVLV